MSNLFSIACFGVVAVGSVDALGWLHGLAVAAAVYLLMPYHPATVRFR